MKRNKISDFRRIGFYAAVCGVICVAGFMAYEQSASDKNDVSQIKLAQEGHRNIEQNEDEDKQTLDEQTSKDNTSSVFGNMTNETEEKAAKDINGAKEKTDMDKKVLNTNDKKVDKVSNKDEINKNNDTKNNDTKKEEKTDDKKNNTKEVTAKGYSFDQEKGIVWPLSGEVLMKYSVDSPIYFETMKSFMLNDGIIIKANEGDDIKCGCDGIVTKVYEDEKYGNMVQVNVGDDYTITYGQLKNIAVSEGDNVTAGQKIANVAAPTSYFSKEGVNVYMKVMEKDSSVDPLLLLE